MEKAASHDLISFSFPIMLFVVTTNIDFYAINCTLNGKFPSDLRVFSNVQGIKGGKSFESLKLKASHPPPPPHPT